MHDIVFKEKTANRYSVLIDGVIVEFSLAMNKIAYGGCDELSKYVDSIEQHLSTAQPLADLSTQINGVNMLRLLESLYRDKTFNNWLEYVNSNLDVKVNILFEQYFGFRHNATKYPDEFGAELTKAAIDRKKKLEEIQRNIAKSHKNAERKAARKKKRLQQVLKHIERAIAVSHEWSVRKMNVENNIAVYEINSQTVGMCLSGHSHLGFAKNVLANLTLLKTGFNQNNSSMVRDAIHAFGGKAAFQLMECFFSTPAKQFFEHDFEEFVLSTRRNPNPSSFLKSYFGGSCGMGNNFYLGLLEVLEKRIPVIEDLLIQTSVEEMSSAFHEWKLFYRTRARLSRCVIRFPAQERLKDEMIEFFHYLYEVYSSSNDSPYPIIQEYDTSILKIIDAIDRPIASVLNLSSWDYRYVISVFASKMSVSTLRSDLFNMRRFVSFLDPDICDKTLPLCIIPSAILNPIKPIDSSVLQKIEEYSDELPEVIRLAFHLLVETGARAGSVFDLTVEDLSKVGNKWGIRIYYRKAMRRNNASGVPSYVPHELSDELAMDLNEFILKTNHFRELLPKKYIFVFESTWFRANTSRLPSVLSSDVFLDAIQDLCKKHTIYDSNGALSSFTAQSVRAEVGRALFAKGASPQDVAGKLHNTATVAKRHYDSMYPADEAAMRRELYSKTVDAAIDSSEAEGTYPFAKNDPMYGSCKSSDMCRHGNDCRNCSEQIQKKQKEV